MEIIRHFAASLSGTVWGWPDVFPAMVAALLLTGLFTTISLRFIQLRGLKHSLDIIRGKYDDPHHKGDLSHFQALTTALSATVGIGNIAGVSTAIHYGGPGALFWMWVTAVFGMALKYAECTLSMKHRAILADCKVAGGPMYYIEKGLGRRWKPLAVGFAVCAAISSFGSGNSIQAFTVADQMRADLGVPTWITGVISASLIAAVILGGITRIGLVTSRLVPFMAIIYVSGAMLVLLLNFQTIPGVLVLVFESAFQPAAQIGGFAGGTFIFMLTWGVKRGLFSNESGQGSAPIAHAAARTDEPVREGLVALMEPLIDTLIICTLTGLVILSTGVWSEKQPGELPLNRQSDIVVIQAGAAVRMNGRLAAVDRFTGEVLVSQGVPAGVGLVYNHSLIDAPRLLHEGRAWQGLLTVQNGTIDLAAIPSLRLSGQMALNGSPLTAWGFQRGLASLMGRWGFLLVTVGVVLFGISTAISWSYYGDRAVVYLWGPRGVLPYKILFCVMNFLGAVFSLEIVWNFGDTALGLMALPNLAALVLLNRQVRALTSDYAARRRRPG